MSEPGFATFLFGSFRAVQRNVARAATTWAARFRQDGTFPSADERPVEPGELIATSDRSDLQRVTPRWRIYALGSLSSGINEALGWEQRDRVAAAMEAHLLETPWGSIGAAVGHAAPNSIEVVARRLDAVARFWPGLVTLRYLGRHASRRLTLQELLVEHFRILLETWGDGAVADAEQLQSVAARLQGASPAAAREATLRALVNLVSEEPRIRNRARLADSKVLDDAWSRILTDEERVALTGLHEGALRRALLDIDSELDAERL